MLSCIPIPSSRALLHITITILCLLGVANSRPTQNITIDVLNETTSPSNNGRINCFPATWADIASFLLVNYVAHGATVVSYPGEPAFDTLLSLVAAILFPTFGVIRAFNFITRRPLLTAKNDLKVAARSGALCMLVRSSSWKPQKGDNIRNALIKDPGNESSLRARITGHSDPSTDKSPAYVLTFHIPVQLNSRITFSHTKSTAALSIYKPPWLNDKTRFWSYTDTDLIGIGSRVVFGLSEPPDQYKFAFVPRNAEVLGLVDPTPTPSSNVSDIPLIRFLYRIFASPVSTPKLSPSFNLVKGMAALVQLLYASFTLFRTTKGEVDQYGFAAPGLTVIPYAIMSALNLVASLVAPHYPTLYLVRSEVMEEAERRTGLPFNYVVGKVVDESDTDNIVKEGWSEIAGSFKGGGEVLCVTHSAEDEDEKIEICDSSSQTIYVPACPRLRRTDDTQTSPLRRFDETRLHGLEFPRYMARRKQALIQPSFFSSSRHSSRPYKLLRPLRPFVHGSWKVVSIYNRLVLRLLPLNFYEMYLVGLIANVEFVIILTLSNYSSQQSTTAQAVWIALWFSAGSTCGSMIYGIERVISNGRKKDLSPMTLRFGLCCYMVIFGVPTIGGFVVVFQMLKAYGICHKSD